jgi:acetylornithine deacetylase
MIPLPEVSTRKLKVCDVSHTLEILEKLIGFNTESAKSNLPLIEWVHEYLHSNGFEVHRVSDASGEKAGLFASIGPRGKGGILLSGHSDVVPVIGQNWTKQPYTMTTENGRAYGRGTCDMKGFLACALALAQQASTTALNQPLKLALSYDEEVGCVGIAHMLPKLDSMIGKPDMCIVGEPTSMRVAVGHKGKAGFRALCKGENGHSSMAPNFVNALHVASDLVQQIRRLQERYATDGPHNHCHDIGYTTLHVGRLSGGTVLNMMPSHAELGFEYRHVPEHAPDAIEADLQQIVDAANLAYSRKSKTEQFVSIEKTVSYPGLETPRSSDIVSFVSALTGNRDTICVPYGTEAGYFSALGIPTIVCGPGSMEEQGHKPDESIGLNELEACDRMLENLLKTLEG